MTESMNPFRLSSLTSENFGIATKMHPVILISLGSQEDHGPQLPMGDYVLAEYLALRIAEQATLRGAPTFVAPSLPFGVADYFGSAPGSMALSAGTFRGVLFDLFGGLLRQSLDKIIILNGHGGNTPVIHDGDAGHKTRPKCCDSFDLSLEDCQAAYGKAARPGPRTAIRSRC